jgi:crotonobetainyl-CoA:carnitine CoA-transferase CaiB-like acyl-CoA transferase
MLGLQNEREWKTFCDRVLLQPTLTTDARFASNSLRHQNRDDLYALIEQAFATLSTGQVVQRLEEAGIANARMNDMAGWWAHPQLKARGRWREVDSPAGPIPALLPPGRNNAFEYRMDAVPRVGEHTLNILRELGLSEATVASLKQTHAI